MIITCPNCATRYSVNAATFPADGRTVKCARCAETWYALPESSAPQHMPKIVAEEPEYNPFAVDDEVDWANDQANTALPSGADAANEASDNVDDDVGQALVPVEAEDEGPHTGEAAGAALIVDDGDDSDRALEEKSNAVPGPGVEAASRARHAARRFMPGARSTKPTSALKRIQAVCAGMMIAIILAGVHYRIDVVRAAPSMAGLYALVGYDINLRGLEFSDVRPSQGVEQGIPVLRVDGKIHNVSEEPLPVPPVRLSLTSQGGKEIYHWTVKTGTRVLNPGESAAFSSLLSAPPRTAQGISVRFEGEETMQLGLN